MGGRVWKERCGGGAAWSQRVWACRDDSDVSCSFLRQWTVWLLAFVTAGSLSSFAHMGHRRTVREMMDKREDTATHAGSGHTHCPEKNWPKWN